jgi:FkbM family methyltransferase
VSRPLPLVSVVTPSLNQGRYLEATIRSVMEQDYPRIEHIVVDGGSTDETLDILRRHEQVRWVSEPDRGQAHALNKGFALARGDVLGWINADDVYLPGAIAAAVEVLRDSGCALVHGGWSQIDENGAVLHEIQPVPFDYRLQLEVRNGVAQPGVLFTREALEAVGGIDESYRYAMDYDLWLKIGARFEVRHVDRILAAYRLHPESKTVAEAEGFWPETWRAARSHGARLRSPLYLDWYLPRARPWLFRVVIGWRLLRRGDLRGLASRVRARLPRGTRLQAADALARRRRRAAARRLYGEFIGKGDLCFDVGANVGNRTEVFLALGAVVVAVEPQVDCAAELRRRFGANGRLTVVESALGAEPGTAELLVAQYDTVATLSSTWVERVRAAGRFRFDWTGGPRVPVTTLDALVDRFGVPVFCKIDVEGYEAEVLGGLSRPLPALSFEYTPEHLEAAIACLDRLEQLGMNSFALSAGESLGLGSWMDRARIQRALEDAPRDGRFFGDVYARSVRAPDHRP